MNVMKATAGIHFKPIRWKVREDSNVTREFFVKQHSQESCEKKPPARTLLVINVPSFISRVNLMHLFQQFGKIEDVYIHQNPTLALPEPDDPLFPKRKNAVVGYKVAYLVFENSQTVTEIMEVNDVSPLICNSIDSGLAAWIKSYNTQIVTENQLEESVKQFMQNYERQEILRKAEEKMKDGEPDEDGWVSVSRRGKGKRSGAIRSEKMEERLKEKRRRFEKRLLNFTPTQIKESRAKQLAELKKKFEEDKQRIAMLKQQRKFKPF